MAKDSPRRLGQKIAALEQFREAYEAYLEATRGDRRVSAEEEKELRRAVSRTLPAAEEATTVQPFMMDPRGFTWRGLSNLAFAHEQGVPTARPIWEVVLDAVEGAIATLEERRKRERRRRWNPLFWIDLVLRAVLGIPAYLVGLVLRMPSERIDESRWGLPLRLAGIVVEGALVVVTGHEVGWW